MIAPLLLDVAKPSEVPHDRVLVPVPKRLGLPGGDHDGLFLASVSRDLGDRPPIQSGGRNTAERQDGRGDVRDVTNPDVAPNRSSSGSRQDAFSPMVS